NPGAALCQDRCRVATVARIAKPGKISDCFRRTERGFAAEERERFEVRSRCRFKSCPFSECCRRWGGKIRFGAGNTLAERAGGGGPGESVCPQLFGGGPSRFVR